MYNTSNYNPGKKTAISLIVAPSVGGEAISGKLRPEPSSSLLLSKLSLVAGAVPVSGRALVLPLAHVLQHPPRRVLAALLAMSNGSNVIPRRARPVLMLALVKSHTYRGTSLIRDSLPP